MDSYEQELRTNKSDWDDKIEVCPKCNIETVTSAYALLDGKITQRCCRTCGKWWDI